MNDAGFEIIDLNNKKSELEIFRSTINETIIRHYPDQHVDLQHLHHLEIPNMNAIRLECFKAINNIKGLDEILERLAGENLTRILGPDLLVQKKLNLSIQTPGDKSSILEPHSDCWSGDSPFQINLWIPLTDTFGTNSMFLFDIPESISTITRIHSGAQIEAKTPIDRQRFLSFKYGQILLFNPALIHGNVLNETEKTRVSLNIRFKSLFSPDAVSTSRSSGTYYRLFKLSNWTKLAFNLNEANLNGK